jgi:succinyl-diaminopimelate desuccinylase
MQTNVDFIKELITIPSNPDNPGALDTILTLTLAQLQEFTIEIFEHNGVKSALVYKAKQRPQKFKVLLNAHLDIIPAKPHQHIPHVQDDKLYGAGAMDMKAGVACFLDVFKNMAPTLPYDLGLQLTTDEEVGGFNGAKYQLDQGVNAEFVIAGEPTNLEIVNQAKGILQAKIHAHGETAHGAYPWRGDNALWKLHDFLSALKSQFPIPDQEMWQTTVNLSAVETPNKAFNKSPDKATAMLDIRFVAEDQDTIQDTVRGFLPKGCTMEVVFFEPAMHTSKNNPFIIRLSQHVAESTDKPAVLRGANGSSDARHFTAHGAAGVEFGPIGGGIGSDDEWVDIPSIERYGGIIRGFLGDL